MIIALDGAYQAAADGRFPGHGLRFFPTNLTSTGEFSAYLAKARALVTRCALPLWRAQHPKAGPMEH